ncbi:MAG TPA: YoaK family protein [Burkholderiaceae bacterium]|nr:YoaK family protein [Burkholderiaceae bacterium]
MAVYFLRRLTGRARTRRANRQLGSFLAFVAGAVNAGGFLAVKQYTSHMTGIVSSVADDLVLGNVFVAFAGLCALLSFLLGAGTTAILINWARHRRMHSEYALSLALEAILLILFGLLGANLKLYVAVFMPATVVLLCYIMGLQNAIVTKISKAEIRTTHVTGLATDLGIELGKLIYWNRSKKAGTEQYVVANRDKLAIHCLILAMFFCGGVTGAFGFKALGFIATVPLALILLFMAMIPLVDDLMLLPRFSRRQHE